MERHNTRLNLEGKTPWIPLERLPVASHGAYSPLVKLSIKDDLEFRDMTQFSGIGIVYREFLVYAIMRPG
jgi:hypothetical protein